MKYSAPKIDFLTGKILKEFKKRRSKLSKKEWQAIDKLVKVIIPPAPKIPAALWQTIMSRTVPTSVELVLILNGKVLLTRRNDKYFKGVHFPGSYLQPGETFLKAARRCAKRELKIKITAVEQVGRVINHPIHNRFHDCSVLLRCKFKGEPIVGEWHVTKPKDLLKVQKEYWNEVRPLLKK